MKWFARVWLSGMALGVIGLVVYLCFINPVCLQWTIGVVAVLITSWSVAYVTD